MSDDHPRLTGMQDFNYLATNCFEITLELNCQKFPPASELETLWKDNVDALLHFMWQVPYRNRTIRFAIRLR